MIKILYVVNGYSPKMETFIYNYIKQASLLKKYEITVLCHYYPDKTFNIDENITVLESKIPYTKNRFINAIKLFITNPIVFIKLLKYGNVSKNGSVFSAAYILKNKNFDVVHAHFGHNANIIAPLIDIQYIKSKFLAHFYGLDMTNPKCKTPGYYKWLLKTAIAYIGSTSFSGELLENLGFPLSKVVLIPVGTNKEIFRYDNQQDSTSSSGKFIILFIGRFIELKGILLIPEIAQEIIKLGITNFEIQIVGSGELQEQLEEKISDIPQIKLLGHKSPIEIKQLLQNADVLLYPGFKDSNGREENQCLTVQEANFMKTTAVVARVGGVPESVIDEVTGFVVEQKDCKEFAKKIKFLYDNPDVKNAMSQKAYDYAL